MIKVDGRAYTVISAVAAERGSNFGQSQDDIVIVPITRFLEDFGATRYTVNVATQSTSPGNVQRDDGEGDYRDAVCPPTAARSRERL